MTDRQNYEAAKVAEIDHLRTNITQARAINGVLLAVLLMVSFLVGWNWWL